ncbi:phage tail fiber protein [Chengkuizengella axinellae]|uniref:Uncharacterized protein n=1 Tax=Chengkuizengella axinellae TaxID=3064388 RepID=A0ABT9IW33_9BACL|nr:hypothetical protein [Chengkuizengella sp. 2205SS18-9]MDP5273556.1 hypothetical protein [Chengkuizengella sp. 2205SS18-9]
MAAMSNYLENKILEGTLRGVTYNAPSTIYLALFTSDPTDAGTGIEVSQNGYERKEITFDSPSNGSTTSNTDVLYDVAIEAWGTITHIGIFDANSGGNLLFHGALTATKTILENDQLKINTGDITVTLN